LLKNLFFKGHQLSFILFFISTKRYIIDEFIFDNFSLSYSKFWIFLRWWSLCRILYIFLLFWYKFIQIYFTIFFINFLLILFKIFRHINNLWSLCPSTIILSILIQIISYYLWSLIQLIMFIYISLISLRSQYPLILCRQ